MKHSLQRLVSLSLIAVSASAPSSASSHLRDASLAPNVRAMISLRNTSSFTGSNSRHKRVLNATGCVGTGNPSFNGILGAGNYAAAMFAGIAAGSSNEACDGNSFIGSGSDNIIGPDKGFASAIVSGQGNNVFESSLGFIGGGGSNVLSGMPYGSLTSSAIVSGSGNFISDSYAFIGAGNYNKIAAPASGSVIGAGANNLLSGTNSAIITGNQNNLSGNFDFLGSGNMNMLSSTDSTIVAGSLNTIVSTYSGILGGKSNQVSGNYSNIVGGTANRAATMYSFIGGGESNAILGSSFQVGDYSSIAGGYANTILPEQNSVVAYSSIDGGYQNTISAEYSAVVGGSTNLVTGADSTIGGGFNNEISGIYAAVGGGYGNINSGTVATIAGGYQNAATGKNSAIPGGAYNVTGGAGAFAAGYRANAATQGSFVWNDDDAVASTLTATVANQFLARASGGFTFYTSPTSSAGVLLAPGSGSWSTLSDRREKSATRAIDYARILARVVALPISEWSYSAEGLGIRHLGPMAQDFRSAFGLGEDERHIATVDEEGVALAAIKALASQLNTRTRELAELRQADLLRDQKLEMLETRLALLEEKGGFHSQR